VSASPFFSGSFGQLKQRSSSVNMRKARFALVFIDRHLVGWAKMGEDNSMVRRMLMAGVMLGALFALTEGANAMCQRRPQARLPVSPLAIETLRGRHAFTVELATKPKQKSCGLMHRPQLPLDAGMLFRHEPVGPSYFWMKNTPEPLDMLFLDAAGRVLHVAEHTVPYSTGAYGTNGPVSAILEVRAGTAARLAIELGDRIHHDWFSKE
jgi:uncharacterized membrane protein (UPF0127 family)